MHAAVCDFLLDIVQNALEAGSSLVQVLFAEVGDELTCTVADNGCGMTAEEIVRIRDPFYTDGKKHTARHVGLGIPFLVQAAEATGGEVEIQSEKGRGTTCRFSFRTGHIDCPPLGDIPGTFLALCSYPGEYDMVLTRSRIVLGDTRTYTVSRSELIDAVGDLVSAGSLQLVRQFLVSQEEDFLE